MFCVPCPWERSEFVTPPAAAAVRERFSAASSRQQRGPAIPLAGRGWREGGAGLPGPGPRAPVPPRGCPPGRSGAGAGRGGAAPRDAARGSPAAERRGGGCAHRWMAACRVCLGSRRGSRLTGGRPGDAARADATARLSGVFRSVKSGSSGLSQWSCS